MSLSYPATRLGEGSLALDGQSVPDPYQWLEDPDAAETRAWTEAQWALAAPALAAAPTREAIRQRLTELWDFPKVSPPSLEGKRWFQWRNTGLQNQPVLFIMTSPTDEGRVVLDPNEMAADGTVAVMHARPTADGSLLAYATSSAGSDWITWRVRDVETGIDLPDVIEGSKFYGGAWLKDGSGFYYTGYRSPEQGEEYIGTTDASRICFHRLGTPQSDDIVVFERPDEPNLLITADTSDDGRFLVVTAAKGTSQNTEVHVLDLEADEPAFQPLLVDDRFLYATIGNVGDDFYVFTDKNAPRRQVVRVRLGQPDETTTVVPEGEHQLVLAALIGGKILCQNLVHATARLSVWSITGEHLHDVALPDISTVIELTGKPDEPVCYFKTTSFTDAGTIWSHDVSTAETAKVATTTPDFDADNIVTEQVFVTSSDGTQIPLFLAHRKDVKPTGDVPVLLYAYGGFNIPRTPEFSVPRAVWIDRGGVFAMPCLRGGGEYGVEWWHDGRLEKKQNVFDDFCAVASWLHESGWSNPSKIAINGGSNGGLLVGACVTQRPELFGAVVCEVGVLDMLRFHKFTVGWAWTDEYGNPEDPKAFEWLIKYSPLHNVRPGTVYPATLVMTGDHDDRVVPAHSYKFAAALQAAQAGDAPILLRVEPSTGHGLGKPTTKIIDERADMLSFIETALS